jgi:hypothetical protein
MLLLTAVTFGGNECADAFAHLPDEEGEILKHRVNALMQIPRDKRIPLVVQEIKRLVTQRRRSLGSADPKRLAEVLLKERPVLVEVVLKALPSTLAEAVRAELPPHEPIKLNHEVRPDILSIIRWKLEDSLKHGTPQVGVFKFSDLLTLQQRELLTICDRMGARALATAFAGLPDEEQHKLFAQLPPDQRSLAQRASEAGKSRKLTEGDSRTVLELFGAGENPSGGMRNAGAQRLARACIAQSREFAIKIIDRHPGELGRLLSKWVKEETNRPIRGDGGRADIVEQMERLSQRGVIDRPMRLPLPPAIRPPSSPAVSAPSNPSNPEIIIQPPSRVLAPPRPGAKGGPVPDKRSEGTSVQRKTGPKPRRDFIAEREARRAGAMSSRVRETGARQSQGTADQQKITSSRLLRDGKPVPRPGTGEQKPVEEAGPRAKGVVRAMTSPALQEIPKRRK